MKAQITEILDEAQVLIEKRKYEEAWKLISGSMAEYPDSPVPHNLLGILLETRREHTAAMKHFRAAYALDPTYIPARYNMEQYGAVKACVKCIFREEEAEPKPDSPFEIVYDERHIGRLVRKL